MYGKLKGVRNYFFRGKKIDIHCNWIVIVKLEEVKKIIKDTKGFPDHLSNPPDPSQKG